MRDNLSKENSYMLKGLAMICIMCGHFLGGWTRLVTPIGGIGVALFLICSGYGLEKSYQKNGLGQFWIKRFWAVFMPYAIFEILQVGLNYDSWLQFIGDVTLMKPMFGYGWYLHYLLIWYVIFYVSHRFIISEKWRDIMHILSSLVLFIYYLQGDQGLQIEQSFMFIFGVFLAKYNFSNLFKKRTAIGCMIIAVIALAVKQVPSIRNSTGQIMRWMDLITKSFMGFGFIGGVAVFKIHKGIKDILGFVGKISYELYLLHGTIIGIVQNVIKSPVGIFPFLIISVGMAYVFHVVLDIIRKKCET